MKRVTFFFAVIVIVIIGTYSTLYSWGFFAHKRINRMAVFTLPPAMIGFYKKHIDYVTEHAPDPDKRRNAIEGEAERHYIDLDHYGEKPFDVVPKYWTKAVEKFTEDTLKAYGIVPWHIQVMLRRLTDAFKEENLDKILHNSADIGHYIGDAHVPLHTTENYNGQLTNQKGIHGFWESRIPELNAMEYDYFVGRAKYIDNPLEATWNAVKASYSAKDSVLLIEAELNKKFSPDRKYSYENRGNMMMKVYSQEYTQAYDKLLNGMVERRMRASIVFVGSMWYTAWVNAGEPDLKRLENKLVTDSLKNALAAEEELWKTGKLQPKGHED